VVISRRTFLPLAAASLGAGLGLRSTTPVQAAGGEGRTTVAVAAAGLTEADLNPTRSSLTKLGVVEKVAVDFNHRSVGADLGVATRVTGIEMPNLNPSNDLTARELSLYVSDDNATWSRVAPARFVNVGHAIAATGFDVTTRFIKVHCHRETTEWDRFTFVMQSTAAVRYEASLAPGLILSGGGSWQWWSTMVVENRSSVALRDRAVHLGNDELGISQLVTAGRLRADLADLRFVDGERHHLHAYADADGVFVRVPALAAGQSTRIMMYCGNPQARDIVHSDSGALQVEYGRRTIQRHSEGTWHRDPKAVTLPSGVIALAAGNQGAGPVRARYSVDNGRTFGPLEDFIPAPDPTRNVSIGSMAVDPDTGVLVACIYQDWGSGEADFLDPAHRSCTSYMVRARSYDGNGHPVFDAPQLLKPYSKLAGQHVPWYLSYSNVIKTRRGSYLIPIAHAYTSDAAFAVSVFRSTDGGATWVQGEDELHVSGGGFEVGLSETTLTELTDGRILLHSRQQGSGRYHFARSTSIDDGRRWAAVGDSTIIASNTFPASFRDDGRLHLTWSGHNAFGADSYRRNNLTAAWSDDEADTWQGYHDLLGATRMSAPGFGTLDNGLGPVVVQADSTSAGLDDRVFSWWQNWSTPYTMLVEDWADYVQHSHGALDVPLHRNAWAQAFGGELNSSRWWRSTASGTLDLVAGHRPTAKAVRLRAPAATTAAASRLFPAIRRGRARFSLRLPTIGTGADLCLQEAFSVDPNARGAALWLAVRPDGTVWATEDHRFDTGIRIGYVQADLTPATGNLSGWATSGNIALDYRRRSIGVDLLTANEFTKVTLSDTPAGTRLVADDLTVWVSETNHDDWRQVTDWTAAATGSSFVLTGPPVAGRYLKVNQPYADDAFTFVNDFSRIITVEVTRPELISERQFRPLDVATNVGGGGWHRFELRADLDAGSLEVWIDGTQRDALPVLHPAAALTHLLVRASGGSNGAELAVDEFLVRDLALPLPTLVNVGEVRAVPPRLG